MTNYSPGAVPGPAAAQQRALGLPAGGALQADAHGDQGKQDSFHWGGKKMYLRGQVKCRGGGIGDVAHPFRFDETPRAPPHLHTSVVAASIHETDPPYPTPNPRAPTFPSPSSSSASAPATPSPSPFSFASSPTWSRCVHYARALCKIIHDKHLCVHTILHHEPRTTITNKQFVPNPAAYCHPPYFNPPK